MLFVLARQRSLDVSPLLGCMSLGATYVNGGGDKHLFKQVGRFPRVSSLFFVLQELKARSDLPGHRRRGGAAYFAVGIAGKYAGAFSERGFALRREVRRYIGFALIPQAGVRSACGLARGYFTRRRSAAHNDILSSGLATSSSARPAAKRRSAYPARYQAKGKEKCRSKVATLLSLAEPVIIQKRRRSLI